MGVGSTSHRRCGRRRHKTGAPLIRVVWCAVLCGAYFREGLAGGGGRAGRPCDSVFLCAYRGNCSWQSCPPWCWQAARPCPACAHMHTLKSALLSACGALQCAVPRAASPPCSTPRPRTRCEWCPVPWRPAGRLQKEERRGACPQCTSLVSQASVAGYRVEHRCIRSVVETGL